MKRLVLLGEGHGEVAALPVLINRLLQEKAAGRLLYVGHDLIRTNPARLVKWNEADRRPDYSQWLSRIALAARRRDIGAVLAVYDGDAAAFPAGSGIRFCAGSAAKAMAAEAVLAGAGRVFSLAVVFACQEYESWLIAGAESLSGRHLSDGRLAIPPGIAFPSGPAESHGKRWLEQHCPTYRPTRDQAAFTQLVDLQSVRIRKLRSFQRLEHAIEQLLNAVTTGRHTSTPV